MSLVVQKYGGSSVANRDRVFNVANRIVETYKNGNSVVVVVSAQGDTTDDLIEKADKVICDVPCSGLGVLSKKPELRYKDPKESENLPNIQRAILDTACRYVKRGGTLVYSTCTFAESEDEGQVCDYLKNHPEMKLISQEKLYPHKVNGEGHFAALFEKVEKTGEWDTRIKEASPWCSREAEKAYREFEKSFFKEKFAFRLYEVNGILYELPEDVFDWKGLQVLRVGVRLGEVRNGRFEPSHSLALCVKQEECKNVLNLMEEDLRLEKYFRGETVEDERIQNGWCVVCVCGYPIGLGKAVNGTVKNHYPKGLRR